MAPSARQRSRHNSQNIMYAFNSIFSKKSFHDHQDRHRQQVPQWVPFDLEGSLKVSLVS